MEGQHNRPPQFIYTKNGGKRVTKAWHLREKRSQAREKKAVVVDEVRCTYSGALEALLDSLYNSVQIDK